MKPRLQALATAVPPHKLDQSDVASLARRLFARRGQEIERLLPVFANAGIESRYSYVPIDWYLESSDWQARNQLYLDNALALTDAAATRSLEAAGLDADEVDSIVAAEIAVLPLAFGAWKIALIFNLLNAALLAWRIRAEEIALAARRHVEPNTPVLTSQVKF